MSVEAIAWALRVPVGGNAKVVLLGLANHAHADGSNAWPAIDTLAEYAHCDRRSVQRNLRKLEEEGWIVRDGTTGRGVTSYSLPLGAAICHPAEPARGDASVPGGATPASPEPSVEPSFSTEVETDPVLEVFTAWVSATKRDEARTKLTPERRAVIRKALASHGLSDCLAAVTKIGRDPFASGENDRGRPFNDVQHALGNAERIERWRDWQPTRNGKQADRPPTIAEIHAAERRYREQREVTV